MSFDAYARDPGIVGDFTDLVDAANRGLAPLANKRGRRQPCKPGVKQRVSQAGLLASLLATEGCLTVGKEAGPLADDAGAQPPAPPSAPPTSPAPSPTPPLEAVDDTNFHAEMNGEILISPDDLLANDQAPQGASLQVVRVFGATHGSVTLVDGLIRFTPDAGYEGIANFFYEVRDANGNLSQASVEIDVAPMDHGDHDGDMGGHDDGMGNHDGGMVHPDDPMKASEHMAMMNLVPVDEATHIAVNNGSWFDPNTWANGEIPGEGAKVLIPEGVEVSYDGESSVSLFTVRIDGALEFATDQDTFMEVDTMVVAPSGRLTIGTADNPVEAGVETVIQIADNGPIDVDWDPQLLSRGVLSHGEIEIHGAYKDTFLKVADDPMAGDTSLTLESAPEGWRVGDKLVITGTHLTKIEYDADKRPVDGETEDEELVITRIEGNVVYFDRPLQYDHEGARDDLKAYVANYTRNVRVQTENADDVPVHQRGHVMLMHSDNIDVRYAEFNELGRTDKSERAFDAIELDSVESDTNVKARYSLHLHRVGVDDPDNPAMLVGNSVWGSPGWGYVHHDSNAILADNAAYDTFGAGFVAETGNEIGRWVHNISIKAVSMSLLLKDYDDVVAFDLARTGVNFWFQGRLVDALDNVAAGASSHGYAYMTRGDGMIDVVTSTADFPETLRYLDGVGGDIPAISQFEGNEAIATKVGFEVIKASPKQGHDNWTMLEDFLAWEVRTGLHIEYTGHYTIKDLDVVGSTGEGGGPVGREGLSYGNNTANIVLNGASIEGFESGIAYTKFLTDPNRPAKGNWDYIFIDVNFANDGVDMPDFNPAEDTILSSADLRDGVLSLDPDFDGVYTHPLLNNYAWDNLIELAWTKSDSIGEVQNSAWDPEKIRMINLAGAIEAEGYWTLPNGDVVTQVEQYFSDRATGDVDKISYFFRWGTPADRMDDALTYNGVLDLDSQSPVARDDFATTGVEERVYIDVLSNDYDPDGDGVHVDGIIQPTHGDVFMSDDGRLIYSPDPNYSGTDEFWYWVEDDNGNFDKAQVTVTVEV